MTQEPRDTRIFPQGTFAEIVQSEYAMVAAAPERFGPYYDFALNSSMFLSKMIGAVDRSREVFAGFHALIKQHHLLAVLSIVRLHKVQAMMNLRQVLEAGACAAYALAIPDPADFADIDEDGMVDPSQKLTGKRYAWLATNYTAGSNALKAKKDQINQAHSHANILHSSGAVQIDHNTGFASAPFFDICDDHFVKTDLWLAGSIALQIADLLYGVNLNAKAVTFAATFDALFPTLVEQEKTLRAELMATDRYKRAQTKVEETERKKASLTKSNRP